MKNTIILVGMLLANCFLFAQTNLLNQQKYWKLRDAFREDFVKISDEDGGSIAARALKPNYCWNNSDVPGVGGGNSLGEMHFGDGMIRHGYYLGLLATEYKLLKNAGKDTRGVLNELYYALEAINRVDRRAEFEQSIIYGYVQQEQLNGFYMREDIPDYFAADNWGNTEMHMNCVNSPFFETNNAAKVNEDATASTPQFLAKTNSYQNVPSMDQLSSLMVGFRLVHKLVDNEFVQPTPSDEGKYVITELKAIVNRIMTYINEHNWMMIDVNGWPVNNGGGDCIWAAFPLYQTAYIITGNQYNTDWTRRLESFYLGKMQYCITGYGLDDDSEQGQDQACNSMHMSPFYQALTYEDLLSGSTIGYENNQNESTYQDWLASGALHGGTGVFYQFWSDPLDEFNSFMNGGEIDLKIPFTAVKFLDVFSDNTGADDDNFGILSTKLATAAGIWSAETMYIVTQLTGNTQLDLINAVLQEEPPHGAQSVYKSYLDEMPFSGPFNFTQGGLQNGAPNGWAAEDRWDWAGDANGSDRSIGIFNGIDYMLYHNLYQLLFPQNLPALNPEIGEECYCGTPPTEPLPTNATQNEINENSWLNAKLAYVPVCTENVFKNYNNEIGGVFNIEPYFSHYDDINIYTNKFETENAVVQYPGGHLNVYTPFIICNNSTLTLEHNTINDIWKRHVSVNSGSTIDVSGRLVVHAGTELRVKSGGHLIVRPGGELVITENCKVIIEQGASLTYYQSAKIFTLNGDNGQLIIKGSLNLEDNAVFSIDHSYSQTSGLIIFDGTPLVNAKAGAKIELTAKSKNDLIVKLEKGTLLKFSDNDLVHVNFTDCGVDMKAPSTKIRFEQPVNTMRAKFSGSTNTSGLIYVTDINLFRFTDFVDAHISAELDIENVGTLRMFNCNFTQEYLPYAIGVSGIDVIGRGYILNNCNFNIYANGNAMVESEKLTTSGSVSGCTFSAINPNTIGETAIFDVSNVGINVSSSNFNSLRRAIDKSTGTLTLKCNTFTNSRVNSVTVRGGLLNMSIATGGGYNTFTTMGGTEITRGHILLEKALIEMSNGSNYLYDVPVAGGLIKGTLQTPCATSSGGCVLDFSGNQWNPLFLITPATNRFNIRSSNNVLMTVNTLVPMAKATCGSLDGGGGIFGIVGSTTNLVLNQIPSYYSQIMGQNLRLDEGIQEAMNRMTVLNDGSGNDLEAIAYLDEIFRGNISYAQGNAITQRLLLQAKRQMKLALESAMALDLITPEQNSYNFDVNTEDFVNGTNRLTSSAVTENNYFKQFYNELDKAQVLRAIGQPETSLELLTELESCGLDFMEQKWVNREKLYAMRDIRIGELGNSFLDSIYVPDSSSFIHPQNYSGDYHFGSIIENLHTIEYQNCFGSKSLNTEANSGLEVFPNPTSEEITIRFMHQAMEGETVLQIFQPDGRLLTTTVLNETIQKEWTTNVSEWTSGSYQYVYIRPDGSRFTGIFVVL